MSVKIVITNDTTGENTEFPITCIRTANRIDLGLRLASSNGAVITETFLNPAGRNYNHQIAWAIMAEKHTMTKDY